MSRRDRNLQDQEFSKKEKKVFGIIGIVCAALMILVIIITVINGSDSHTIASDYELSNDNVYEYITLEEMETKKKADEKFHVVIVRSNNNKTKTFMQIVNSHAKKFGIETIYLMEAGYLAKTDGTKLTALLEQRYDDVFGATPSMTTPAIVYFENGYPIENSGLTSHSNQTSQIKEYFSNCGYTYED